MVTDKGQGTLQKRDKNSHLGTQTNDTKPKQQKTRFHRNACLSFKLMIFLSSLGLKSYSHELE